MAGELGTTGQGGVGGRVQWRGAGRSLRGIRRSVRLLMAAAAVGTAGCSSILDSGEYLTVEVAEGVVPCPGAGAGECMLVRWAGAQDFELFHDHIVGFQLEPGYRYRLRLSRHAVATPPADGTSQEWRLVRVESKQRSPRWAELRLMQEQVSRWRESRPPEYGLVVSVLCYCGPAVQGPVRVEVRTDSSGRAEEALARLYTEDGTAVPADLWQFFPTVDGLFARIVHAAAQDVHGLEVEYDDVYGYPRRVTVNPHQYIADDEVEYRVLELVPR